MKSQANRNPSNTLAVMVFAMFTVIGLCLFLVPAFIIRPFHYQSLAALSIAMVIRGIAPTWTIVAAVLALLLALILWRRVSHWQKALLVLGVLLIVASATMARMNYFEWMFHPIAAPGFESAAATKLDSSEMVMAVRFGNDFRAYPIREMAYHHVLNDVVGGVPIAVTY